MDIYHRKNQERFFNKIEQVSKSLDQSLSTVSPVRNYRRDNRLCLTCVYFLEKEIKDTIESKLILPLKEADPLQYYYSRDSLHLTIQNIRVIHDPPSFSSTEIEKVIKVFENVITNSEKPSVCLEELLMLKTSMALRGYVNEEFHNLVKKLRHELKKSGIEDDKTYISNDVILSNVTFCRFIEEPNRKFQKVAAELKKTKIGEIVANKASLIVTNAACHPEKTKIVGEYYFKNSL